MDIDGKTKKGRTTRSVNIKFIITKHVAGAISVQISVYLPQTNKDRKRDAGKHRKSEREGERVAVPRASHMICDLVYVKVFLLC